MSVLFRRMMHNWRFGKIMQQFLTAEFQIYREQPYKKKGRISNYKNNNPVLISPKVIITAKQNITVL